MDIQAALKQQYHAGLAMLAECVERCPDDLWLAPNPSDGLERAVWRIAFHDAYFTHLYLGQNEAAFQPPPEDLAVRGEAFARMWNPPGDVEPYELPTDTEPLSQADILRYIAYVDALIDPTVDGLDLASPDSGFGWYKNITKLSHQLMNLRHLQGHVGQLSELLLARGIDTRWISR